MQKTIIFLLFCLFTVSVAYSDGYNCVPHLEISGTCISYVVYEKSISCSGGGTATNIAYWLFRFCYNSTTGIWQQVLYYPNNSPYGMTQCPLGGCNPWECYTEAWSGNIDYVANFQACSGMSPSDVAKAKMIKEMSDSGLLEYILNDECGDGNINNVDYIIKEFEAASEVPNVPFEKNQNVATNSDPIYTSNGEYGYSATDVVLPGRGIPVVIQRSFGSQREYNGRFGYGWNLNYNMKVRPLYTQNDPNTSGVDESEILWNVMLIDEGGFSREYSRADSQTMRLTRSGDRSDYIEYNPEGAYPYTLVKKNGLRYQFDENGNLVQIEDPHGNAIQLQYSAGGLSDIIGNTNFFLIPSQGGPENGRGLIASEYKLEKIIDTLGREILFFYNSDGLLTEIRVSDLGAGYRSWLYHYDAEFNVLLSVEAPEVQDPNNPTQTYRPATYYAYDNRIYPRAITAIYDAANNPQQVSPTPTPYLVNTYDPNGKVIEQVYGKPQETDPNSDAKTLNIYDPNNHRCVVHSRQKVDPNEGKRIDISVYTDSGQTLSETVASNANDAAIAPRAFTTAYEYNSMNEVVKAILPKRNCVEYDRLYIQDGNDFNLEEVTIIQRPECDVLPFNGASDSVQVADGGLYAFHGDSNDFSVAFWVKRLRDDTEEILFDKRDADNDGWCLKFDSANHLVLSVNTADVVSSTMINDTEWHYVVAVADYDGTGRIYIDGGDAEGTAALGSPVLDIASDLFIGRCSYNTSGYFKGSLDEVMILNRALTTRLDTFGLSQYSQNLVGYWKMDDNAANTAVDDSSASNKNGVAARNTETMVADGSVPGEIETTSTFIQNNGLDFVKTATDSQDNTITYTYDFEDPNLYSTSVGNLMKITYPAVSTPQGLQMPEVHFTYNAYGQIVTTTSADGIVARYDYYADANDAENYGRLWKVTADYGSDPACLNIVTTYEYDSYGNASKVTDTQNHSTEFTYNDLDQLVETQLPSPFNYQTEYAYHKTGELFRTRRAIGAQFQSIEYAYDILGNLKTIKDPLSHITTSAYDDNENKTSITDAENHQTLCGYDERDMLWKTINAEGGVTEYAYDGNGNLKTIKDANDNITSYIYDSFDRRIRTTYADNTYEECSYNSLSQLVSFTTRRGDTITYSYDALGRVMSKVGPGNDLNIRYVYDISGRVIDVNDSGAITHYTYDRLGRVIQVEDTQNRLVDYEYDSLSRRTKLVYPDDSFITYEYDNLSRLTKIIDDSNAVIAEYTYDELSRRVGQVLANDANTVYAYDLANRLTSLDTALNDPNNPLLAFDYSYDNVGNRLTMTVDNAAQHSYAYNAIYQLTFADYPAGQGADTAYGYDSVFNRTSVNNGSVINYSVNGLNQYTAVGSASLTYDNNGNLTSDGVYTYEYDTENHLLVVKLSGTAVVSYNYNASGRRVSKTVYPTGQYVQYCYDGDQVIAEYDGAGTLLRKFVYGPGVDEPICMIAVDGQTETRYYYHYDGLGSVVALSNNSGTIVERYRYSAFGETQILSPNFTPRTASLVGNPYMFTGRELETLGSGSWQLYYYRARFYSPSLGRFLQTDPIGYADGINWYAYCGNNPVSMIDPYGLKAGDQYETPALAAIAAMQEIYKPSINNNMEYGGVIYKNSNKTYSYTEPISGEDVTVTVKKPFFKKTVATYHSHGGDRGAESDEKVSYNDMKEAHQHKLNSYLITPKGKMLVYPYEFDDYLGGIPVNGSLDEPVYPISKTKKDKKRQK